MTVYQFNALNEAEKHIEILRHAVYIGEREEGEYRIDLHQIHSFYVELFYHQTNNSLQRLRSFSSTEQLNPYLKKFDLSDLL